MQQGLVARTSGCKRYKHFGLIAVGLIAYTSAAKEPNSAPPIFRCEVQGSVVFSDRPCATASSTEIVLRPVNSYHNDATIGTSRAKTKTKVPHRPVKESESITAEAQRAKQRCQRLADQLVNIESTLRSGYSAKEGERLRERQRQLEQRRRTERCR
jgi:hypothetical protein